MYIHSNNLTRLGNRARRFAGSVDIRLQINKHDNVADGIILLYTTKYLK